MLIHCLPILALRDGLVAVKAPQRTEEETVRDLTCMHMWHAVCTASHKGNCQQLPVLRGDCDKNHWSEELLPGDTNSYQGHKYTFSEKILYI